MFGNMQVSLELYIWRIAFRVGAAEAATAVTAAAAAVGVAAAVRH